MLTESEKSGPSGFLGVSLAGAQVGAGLGVLISFLYGILFGVIGMTVNRLFGSTILPGPYGLGMIPIFLGIIISTTIIGFVIASLYHIVCSLLPIMIGAGKGIVFGIVIGLAAYFGTSQVVGETSYLFPIGGTQGIFGIVSFLLAAAVIGELAGSNKSETMNKETEKND